MSANKDVIDVIRALERAKVNVPKDWDYLATDEKVIIQVMELEYDLKSLGDQIGVSRDLFPSVEQLEDDEIKLIVDKILDTWSMYHYQTDLPKGLPIRIAYTTLLSVWDEIVPCLPFGNFHFDFYDLDLDQYITKGVDDVLRIDSVG